MTGVELFTIGSTAVTLADAFTVAGAITGAAGAVSTSRSQANTLEFQSQVANQRAQRERDIAQLESRRLEEDNERFAATQRALLGATRGDLSGGSALLLQKEVAEEAAFNEALVRAGGETRATRLEQSGRLRRAEAAGARRAGGFRAGSTLLAAGGELFG